MTSCSRIGNFTDGYSAALLQLTEEWKENLDQNHVLGAAALDLSKAFDCIHLMLEKLIRFYELGERSWLWPSELPLTPLPTS